jgi:hypothetical protein
MVDRGDPQGVGWAAVTACGAIIWVRLFAFERGDACPRRSGMLCHNVRMNVTNIFLRCAVLSFVISGAMLAAQAPAAPGAPAPTSETAVLVKQAQQLNSEGKQDEALTT